MKEREPFYDVLKALAIILVALGHVVPTFAAPSAIRSCFSTSFSMPLFIAISGYFFAKSAAKKSAAELIRTRFVHIMIPSLSFGFINMLMAIAGKLIKHKPLEISYLSQLLVTTLWFLSVLFILSAIGAILKKYLKGAAVYWGWLVVWGLLYFSPTFILHNGLEYLCPFFVLGMAGSRIDWSKLDGRIAAVALVVFCVVLHYFTWDMSMYRMDAVGGGQTHLLYTLMRLAGGLSGILVSLYFVRIVMYLKPLVKVLSLIGTMTLPIYVLHQKFLFPNMFLKWQTNNVLIQLAVTALIVALSIGCYKILRRNRYLAFWLFGERRAD